MQGSGSSELVCHARPPCVAIRSSVAVSNATSQSGDLVDDLGSLSAASRRRQHQACRGYSAVGQDFDTEPCCSCGMPLNARRLRFWNGFGVAEVLLLMLLIGPFVTSELND